MASPTTGGGPPPGPSSLPPKAPITPNKASPTAASNNNNTSNNPSSGSSSTVAPPVNRPPPSTNNNKSNQQQQQQQQSSPPPSLSSTVAPSSNNANGMGQQLLNNTNGTAGQQQQGGGGRGGSSVTKTNNAITSSSSSSTSQVVQYQKEIEKLKYELAEVIDEVVFAENEKVKAEDQLSQINSEIAKVHNYSALLEDTVENLLSYACQLEQNCLLPAVGDLNTYFKASDQSQTLGVATANRDQAIARVNDMLQQVPNKQRQQLLDVLRGPLSTFAMERVNNVRRAAIPPVNKHLIPLEDAVVLVNQYIKAKEELLVLMTDAKQRLHNAAALNPATEEQIEASPLVAGLRKEVETLKGERAQLLTKTSQSTTYEELQKSYYSDRESLQKKILDLEQRRRDDERDRFIVAQRFETLQAAMDQAHQERDLLKTEVDKVRKELTSAKIHLQASGSDSQREAHSLRIEMDRLIRDHSSLVTQLEGQIAHLRMELAEAKSGNASSHGANSQLQQLHHDNDALRRSLATLQSRMSSNVGSMPDSSSSGGGGGGSGLDGKIRAFETTISALNTELSQVEGKISNIEAHYKDERNRVVAQFDDERRQFMEEREECDALVLKMTNELEFLVRENAALKLKARSVQ